MNSPMGSITYEPVFKIQYMGEKDRRKLESNTGKIIT
jgi:hypothetical protein